MLPSASVMVVLPRALAAHDHHTARALDGGAEPHLELGAPPLLGTGAGVTVCPLAR